MSVTAIVCELNPLHNGHMHVMKAAESDAVVLVMSGNFTQRALSAAFHKYARAEAAVRSGADLVVELPFPYCSSGGEFFARAGVSIAERLGADRLVFGSSCADRGLLSDIARTLSSFPAKIPRSRARRGGDKIEGARRTLPRIFPRKVR